MIICEFKKLNFLYETHETFEAGLVLFGDEVKSIKNKLVDLSDAYVKIDSDMEIIISNLKITFYKKANPNTIKHRMNRNIKVLLTKKEILKLKNFLDQKKYTAIPSKIFIKNNLIKVEIAIVSGKKKFNKKEDLKNRSIKREIQRNYKLNV